MYVPSSDQLRVVLSILLRRCLLPGFLLLVVISLGQTVAWRSPTTVLLTSGGLSDPAPAVALVALLALRMGLLLALGPWLVDTVGAVVQGLRALHGPAT